MKYNTLPSVLTLHGIVCDPQDPLAGGFANVWRGTYDNLKVAVKVLRVQAGMTDEDKMKRDQVRRPSILLSDIMFMIFTQAFLREILLWTSLNHPHIVPFFGITTDIYFLTATENTAARIGLVLPWMKNGSLRQNLHMLRTQGPLTTEELSKIVELWVGHCILSCRTLCS